MRARFLCLILLAMPAMAGEFVVLSSGFRLHAERHETDHDTVRLFTANGVIELPGASIVAFEFEDYVAPPPVAKSAKMTLSPKEMIDETAERYGLPPEILHSVASIESAYRQDAVSSKGAIGVMQLMPATAAELDADPLDTEQNIDAGARYLRELLLKYDGGLHRTLAAYNAGPGAVERYNGIPPYRETQLYVEKVLQRFKKLAGD